MLINGRVRKTVDFTPKMVNDVLEYGRQRDFLHFSGTLRHMIRLVLAGSGTPGQSQNSKLRAPNDGD